jgi:FHS family Na+ dependent glucose MFS transporter 1
MRNVISRLIGYFSLFICFGLDMALLGPSLPDLAKQTGSSLGTMGLVFTISSGGFCLGTLLGGWLYDRIPGRPMMIAGHCIVAVLTFLTPHIPWFGLLMALYIVKGIAGGTVHVGGNTLLMWTFGGNAGPYLNALHFFFGVGAFCSPFLLGLLIDSGRTYADAYHFLALIDLLVAAVIWRTLQAPPPKTKGAGEREARGGRRYLVPLVLSAMLFLFFYVGSEITFGGWISTYAQTLNMADAARAAYLTAVLWLAFTIGRLISIPASVRFKPTQILPAALGGCAVFIVILIAFPQTPEILWIAAAGAGFCMAPVWPTGFNLAGQSVEFTARISGFILLGDSMGGMVLPGMAGWVMEQLGAGSMPQMVLAGAGATFLAFLGIVFFGRKQGTKASPSAAA